MGEPRGFDLWNRLLGAALAMPGVRVDRISFLQAALSAHVSLDVTAKAIETTPAKAGVSRAVIKKAAKSSINWHRAGVSATSAVSGLPGGWWVAGTLPVDVVQYQWHVLVVLQKLAYLHGWPVLLQQDEDVDDETKLVLTLFIGVMLCADGANAGLAKFANALAENVVKRLPKAALTKYAIYQIAKQVAGWIGVRITKRKFAEFIGRVIPLFGGLFSGLLTWYAFGDGARRLVAHLETLPLAEP